LKVVVKKASKKGKAERRKSDQIPHNSTPKKEETYKPRVWMKAFITALSRRGIVSQACVAAKIDRTTAYKARDMDATFSAAWDEAMEVAADALEGEAWRRAVEGVEKPVGFYQGVASEHVREYSDTLLIFMLKGARPAKYRERVEHSGKVELVGVEDAKKALADFLAKNPGVRPEEVAGIYAAQFKVKESDLISEAVN
jgi:hypothetical protein